MRRIWTVLLAALAILSLSVAPASATGGGTVSGIVTDAAGHPLQGVSVFFGFTGPTTAADGSYSITVPNGTYSVMIGSGLLPDGTGHYSMTGIWQATVNGDMVENFTLPAFVPLHASLQNSSGTPLANTEIQVPTSILDTHLADGNPIRWFGNPARYTSDPPLKTDGTGQITFSALLGSTTTIRAQIPNVFPAPMPVAVPTDPTTATVRMPPLHQLRGALTDTTGAGIPNASVEISAPDGGFLASSTSSVGTYAYSVPDGSFAFDASFGGFPTAGFHTAEIKGAVTIAGDTTFSAVMPTAVPIRVHLQHPDGSPATEASVTQTDSSTTITSSVGSSLTVTATYQAAAQPDATHGIAVTQALAGTDTTLTVSVPDQSAVTSEMTAPTAATDPNGPPDSTITIVPAGSASATVSGVVRDDGGQPLAGAQILLRSSATNTTVSATTAADGSWSAKVVPGTITIKATFSKQLPVDSAPGTVGWWSIVSATGKVPVTITATQDINLPSPELFTLRILDASDKPIPDVSHFFPPTSDLHRTMGGVDFDVTGGANGGGPPSDANGNMTMWALDDSTVSGSLQQAHGYVSPFTVDVSTPAVVPTVHLMWFGSVQSQGSAPGDVVISAPAGTTLTQLSSTPAATTPDGQKALVGALSYQLSGIPVGSTQDVTLTLPAGSQATNVFKVASDGTTVDATSHATISGNTIVMHLTDGGFGDADGIANGVIVDPLLPTASTAPIATSVVAGSSPSLASPVTVNAGSPYTFTGTIRAGGAPAHGAVARVLIRKLGTTAWGGLGYAVADANGNLSYTFTPPKNCQLMWVFDGAPGYAPSNSSAALREVDVRPRLSLAATSSTIRLGSQTKLWGVMSPALVGEVVTLQKVVNGVVTTFRITATVKHQTLPNGHLGYGYVMPFTPSSRGAVTYRVVSRKDANYTFTISNTLKLTVW